MKKRVVVGMSGGVDSAVAAALLKKQGYEVIGVTMCFNLKDSARKKAGCCSLQGIEDARRVAHKLGIKHYVLNMGKVLEERVIKNFCQEYLLGRTPNPCVLCNQYLKFGELLNKAHVLGADFLATGHYARVVKTASGFLLKKAKDPKKDQSYFLYRLNQAQLKHIIFPLGNYTKEEVRDLARKFKLPVAEKKASQEICFLPDDDYRAFLKARINKDMKPGPVVDTQGNIVGQHKGIAYYTIGQREGLGIAKGYPVYITRIDPKTNKIFIGSKEDASKREFIIKELHYALKAPIKKKVAFKVKIRYNHKEAEARIIPSGKKATGHKAVVWPPIAKAKIVFKKPQFAITPGQSAVFYRENRVLGGAIIDKVID
ncbi:MAG: tRNA 2-thiouridine(34) synthase MnmA [Candidatus Omnitrophica bacterium]|nr:tRNA 2-thiouridine(34) synthase MnmA [Candidatus Omnitrophota bacterium]